MLTTELWLHVAEAAGLGLGLALILWLLRNYAPARRVRLSLFLSALLLGLYWILLGANLSEGLLPVKIVLAAGIMLGANAALQFFDIVLWEYLLGRRRHIDVPRLVVDIFNFIALAAVALALLNGLFNVNLNALLVTSTVLSAVIGLALQDLLTSIVAGLALQFEQPFRVGDWVVVSGQEGRVIQMNWRTLTLRTRDNAHLILPNSNVAKQDIVNYSRPTPLQRQHIRLGLAYQHPPGEAEAVLTRTILACPGVCATPAPEIAVVDYGDFSIHYDLRYWIDNYERAEQIRAGVLARLWYELRRAGLTIPFPIRDITMRALPEDHEARRLEQQRREVFAELRRVSLFAPLSDEQIETVARGATLQRYAIGELLVRQGNKGDSLFVIKAGQVRVDKRGDDGQPITVATLGPDEFFGEMSLLTGELRSASVVALEETEAIEVDQPDLAVVIKSDARLLEALSNALEARIRNSLEKMLEGATGPLTEKRPFIPRGAFLLKIQQFFGVRSN